MNIRKKIGLLSVASTAALTFSLFGCVNVIEVSPSDEDVEELIVEGKIIDYRSYKGSEAAFFVENKSTEKLIAFKGKIDKEQIIGGVPPSAKMHGLKANSTLFQVSGDFPLVLVKEKDYIDNVDNLGAAPEFVTIYAFHNKGSVQNTAFPIPNKGSGNGKIVLNNRSNWNVEIRKGGPTGEVMGYVAAQTTNMVLHVADEISYDMYPILKKFVPAGQIMAEAEILEIVPTFSEGDFIGMPISNYATVPKNGTITWDLLEITQGASFNLSSGGVFIEINNQSGVSAIFYDGSEQQTTSIGLDAIPAGKSNMFSKRVDKTGDSYPKTLPLGSLKVGVPGKNKEIPFKEYKVDYRYRITTKGNNPSTFDLYKNKDLRDVSGSIKYKKEGWINDNTITETSKDGRIDKPKDTECMENENKTAYDCMTSQEKEVAEEEYEKWLEEVYIEEIGKLDLTKYI